LHHRNSRASRGCFYAKINVKMPTGEANLRQNLSETENFLKLMIISQNGVDIMEEL